VTHKKIYIFLVALLTLISCTGSGPVRGDGNPAPFIAWFTASPPGEGKNVNTILRGQNAVLQYSFSGGTGVITPTVGNVNSEALSTVSPLVTTTYTLVVTNSTGKSVSSTATVNVNSPPTVSVQPLASQTIPYGSPATLNIVATATDALSYQWYKSGKPLLGSTQNSLTLSSVTEDAVYRCDVTNTLNGTLNTTPSNNAAIYVNRVLITEQPVGGSTALGAGIRLMVNAEGSGLISYQWLKNGSAIDSAVGSSYLATSTGVYTCLVTSTRNNVPVSQLSNPATVTINDTPTATSLTAGASTITSGNSTTLTPTFSGGTGKIGTTAGGNDVTASATSGTAVTITPGSTTTYYLTVTNAAGSTASATRTVNVNSLSIISQPQDSTILDGETTTLTVGASGTGSLSYQWYRSSSAISGATAGSYSTSTTGSYYVEVTSTLNGTTVTLTSSAALISIGSYSATAAISSPGIDMIGAMLTGTGEVIITGGYTVSGASIESTYSYFINPIPDEMLSNSTYPYILVPTITASNAASYYSPTTATWTTATAMSGSRYNHTATTLADGSIFVVGGTSDGSTGLATSEIYDRTANTWTSKANITNARYWHTATALGNGKILVAGGYTTNSTTTTSDCRLYTPSSNTWSSTGAMATARAEHSAIVLADGRVLVTGGYSGSASLSSSEIYDPSLGTWSSATAMSSQRRNHASITMPNGLTLITGGRNDATPSGLSTVAIYNPANNSWTNGASLSTQRFRHSMTTAPNGRIIITGGLNTSGSPAVNNYLSSVEIYSPSGDNYYQGSNLPEGRRGHFTAVLPNGNVLVAGGATGDNTISTTTKEYNTGDQRSNTFTATGSLTTARAYHTATLLNSGKFLIAGGYAGGSDYFAGCELYDPSTGTWSSTGSLTLGRRDHEAVLLPTGKVLLTGGYNPGGGTAIKVNSELFNPTTGTWGAATSMNTKRQQFGLVWSPLVGKAIAIGGDEGKSTMSETVESYDPYLDTWTNKTSMATGRSGHTVTVLSDGKILVTGGYSASNTVLSSVEVYDPVANTWTTKASMSTARHFHKATLMPDGKVLVTGGAGTSASSPSYLNSVEVYDPVANTWTSKASFTTARYRHISILMADGKILLAGGQTGSGTYTNTAYVYDPVANTWTAVGNLTVARGYSSASLLPTTGRILVVGGWGGSSLFYGTTELYW
jgi:N-acetylneuraminic acid mutarotase